MIATKVQVNSRFKLRVRLIDELKQPIPIAGATSRIIHLTDPAKVRADVPATDEGDSWISIWVTPLLPGRYAFQGHAVVGGNDIYTAVEEFEAKKNL